MDTRLMVLDAMRDVAREQGKILRSLDEASPLGETGLDSLCFAVLVARLEDATGRDPFADMIGKFPETVGGFIELYERAAV